MRRLGYERYGAHGGDIGGGVAGDLSVVDPERVVGVHVDNRSADRSRRWRPSAARTWHPTPTCPPRSASILSA